MKNRPYPLYEHREFHTLKELVCRQAKEKAEQTAFFYSKGKETLIEKSYCTFKNEIDALGTYLLEQNHRNEKIAIIGENCYEWLLAFMAVVNSGNVAVAIDRELPADRILQLVQYADCKAVIYSLQYADVGGQISNEMTGLPMADFPSYLVKGQVSIDFGSTIFVSEQIEEDKPAAIFFTSGTTGESKGVVLSHKNLCFNVYSASKNVVLHGSTISVLPYHHSFGLVAGVLAVFHYGFPVFINQSLKRLLPEMSLAKPQNTFLVPLFVETFYRQIWDAAEKSGRDVLLKSLMKVSNILLKLGIDLRKKLFSSVHQVFGGCLECIVCGGAPLDEKYIKAFRSWGIMLLNGYGITECSPVVSVNRNHYWRDKSVGQVLCGCQVKIGEDGEVLVKGDNVMLGYYKNETGGFLQDGWYATGDLGYVDKDNFLFLTGRKKNLIILSNGENVSPEELEQEIIRDDAVAEAVVYDKAHVLTVQIYPRESYMGKQEYFEKLIQKINRKQPIYKRINQVILREREFEKSTTKKILRQMIQ